MPPKKLQKVMNSHLTDTIAAIATPHGVGGIAVVRLSGPGSAAISAQHCKVAPGIHYSMFRDGDTLIDEVMVAYHPAPHSYTGEDVVEISCHGSLYVQEAILNTLLASGARLAEPGEFTRRAFLSGKLDLSQAEAVADLIDSTNATQHRLAVSQLRGGYAQTLRVLRQQLLELTSLLELELDFSQEDVEFADRNQLRALLSTLNAQLETLISSFKMGNALKQGIPIAIIGRPNAGKSSLLNALLHDDRAIVSPIPGTTRDTIEETFILEDKSSQTSGIPFRIIDTAGLRESDDEIEMMGIQRTLNAVAQADIVLYVHDATQPETQISEDLQKLNLDNKHLIIIYNKVDLLDNSQHSIHNSQFSPIHLSAKTGNGLDTLLAQLSTINAQLTTQGDVLLTNVRHLESLKHTHTALLHVAQGLADGLPADLVAIDLRDALHHLGTITGEVTTDEVLGNIFGRFCVGK